MKFTDEAKIWERFLRIRYFLILSLKFEDLATWGFFSYSKLLFEQNSRDVETNGGYFLRKCFPFLNRDGL